MNGKVTLGTFLGSIVVALLLLGGGRTVASQSPLPGTGMWELFGHLEGRPSGPMVVRSNYIYMAFSNKLVVLDASSPASPQRVGSLFLQESLQNMVVQREHLYAITTQGTLYNIDITNPVQPVLQQSLYLDRGYYTLHADEQYIYAGRILGSPQDPMLDILVNSEGGQLALLGSYSYPLVASLVGTHGGYLYLLEEDTLQILSLADLAHPAEVGHLALPPEAGWSFAGATLRENTLYILKTAQSCSRVCGIPEYKLLTLDVSAPATPTLLAYVDVPRQLAGYGSLKLFVVGTYGYFIESSAEPNMGIINVIDLSNPTSLRYITSYSRPNTFGVMAGTQLYLTSDVGLSLNDASVPEQLRELGSYDTLGHISNIAAENHRLYVSSSIHDLALFDLTTPTSPRPVGQYNAEGEPLEIAVRDNRIYSLWYRNDPTYGDQPSLRVLDASNPLSPTLTSTLVLSETHPASIPPNAPTEMEFSENHLYLLWNYRTNESWGRILKLELTNPAAPTRVAEYRRPYAFDGFAVKEPYAYLLRGGLIQSTFSIVDLSDPITPTEAISYTLQGTIEGVTISDDHAYLGGSRLETWDISAGNSATPLTSTESRDYYWESEWDSLILGEHLYAAGGGQFRVFDLSNPISPTLPSLQQPFWTYKAEKVVTSDGYVYGAAGDDGIFIFRYRPLLGEVTTRLFLPMLVR